MQVKALQRRLERIEAANLPRSELLVCLCAERNGYRNLPEGQHLAGCPAGQAGVHDHVVRLQFAAGKEADHA